MMKIDERVENSNHSCLFCSLAALRKYRGCNVQNDRRSHNREERWENDAGLSLVWGWRSQRILFTILQCPTILNRFLPGESEWRAQSGSATALVGSGTRRVNGRPGHREVCVIIVVYFLTIFRLEVPKNQKKQQLMGCTNCRLEEVHDDDREEHAQCAKNASSVIVSGLIIQRVFQKSRIGQNYVLFCSGTRQVHGAAHRQEEGRSVFLLISHLLIVLSFAILRPFSCDALTKCDEYDDYKIDVHDDDGHSSGPVDHGIRCSVFSKDSLEEKQPKDQPVETTEKAKAQTEQG